MAKATEYAIYAFQLAQERITKLEELIQVRKKRKTTSRKYIKNGKLLSASDVRQEHVDESNEEDEDTIVIRVAGAQRRCGRCGTIGHNSRTVSSIKYNSLMANWMRFSVVVVDRLSRKSGGGGLVFH